MTDSDNGDRGENEKQVSAASLDQSVIDRPDADSTIPTPSLESTLLWFIAKTADEMTPWGTHTKARDRELRAFYPTESYFSSALGVVAARNAAFSWTLEGPPRTTEIMKGILQYANGGKGWHDFMVKTSIDLYTQDNGAFWEIVRSADSPTAPVVALNTLDAAQCWHTGDPTKPVIYRDRLNEYHLLPWYNVLALAEMPAPIEGIYGLQLCALTRMLRAVQVVKNVITYKEEKTGGRFTRAIHLLKGVTTDEITDAMQKVQAEADQSGLLRYIQPMLVGAMDPKADVGHDTIEMASMPDNFSEEATIKLYITIIAMAFLSDYQDFAPLPGGNLGTSTQSEVLHMKSRGKGPALFMGLIKEALNGHILPRIGVEFSFDEQDLEAEATTAKVKKDRAETRKLMSEGGEVDARGAAQMAVDVGDMPVEVFTRLHGADVTEAVVSRSGMGHGHRTEHLGRISKGQARYRLASSMELEADERCKACGLFQYDTKGDGGQNTCEKVEGSISQNWLCDLYEKGSADPTQQGKGDKLEVTPPRAGPFRGETGEGGSETESCCGDGSCCYTD